jgi:hypothetical protein
MCSCVCLCAQRLKISFPPGRLARGGHGLPKVSPGPAMTYPSIPCGTTPETALWAFQGWTVRRAGGMRLSSTPLDTPRNRPLLFPLCCSDFGSASLPRESQVAADFQNGTGSRFRHPQAPILSHVHSSPQPPRPHHGHASPGHAHAPLNHKSLFPRSASFKYRAVRPNDASSRER